MCWQNEWFLEDIAHSLSLTCRYNGHCREFYSVAEHSMHLAKYLERTVLATDREARLAALLHDASEAYLSDVPSPVKRYLNNYRSAEMRVGKVIHQAFGLPWPMHHELIKRIDTRILVDEADALMRVDVNQWRETLGPALGIEITCLPPATAEREFLEMFSELTRKEGRCP